ncbi:MAG: rod shape-determining protein MreC [Burkholderiales bacterium]|nr:rod shape-determining protein MreC [Burkholderiales bacterium]
MQDSPAPIFKRGPSPAVRLAFFSLLSLVMLVADARFRYGENVRAIVSVALYPLQQAAAMPGMLLSRAGEFFVTQASLVSENNKLRREALDSAARMLRLQALETENAQLHRLLDAPLVPDRKSRVATVLYEPRDPFTRRIIIDQGLTTDVSAGQAVIDHLGVVGQITRVFPLVSEVSLITDKSQSVPVQDVRSGLRAVTFGLGHDGALELRFIPVNSDIQIGDVLVTSGIDGTYPPGLPVAVVANIERNAAFAFARITCTPTAGLANYRHVVVLSPPDVLPPDPTKTKVETPVETRTTRKRTPAP